MSRMQLPTNLYIETTDYSRPLNPLKKVKGTLGKVPGEQIWIFEDPNDLVVIKGDDEEQGTRMPPAHYLTSTPVHRFWKHALFPCKLVLFEEMGLAIEIELSVQVALVYASRYLRAIRIQENIFQETTNLLRIPLKIALRNMLTLEPQQPGEPVSPLAVGDLRRNTLANLILNGEITPFVSHQPDFARYGVSVRARVENLSVSPEYKSALNKAAEALRDTLHKHTLKWLLSVVPEKIGRSELSFRTDIYKALAPYLAHEGFSIISGTLEDIIRHVASMSNARPLSLTFLAQALFKDVLREQLNTYPLTKSSVPLQGSASVQSQQSVPISHQPYKDENNEFTQRSDAIPQGHHVTSVPDTQLGASQLQSPQQPDRLLGEMRAMPPAVIPTASGDGPQTAVPQSASVTVTPPIVPELAAQQSSAAAQSPTEVTGSSSMLSSMEPGRNNPQPLTNTVEPFQAQELRLPFVLPRSIQEQLDFRSDALDLPQQPAEPSNVALPLQARAKDLVPQKLVLPPLGPTPVGSETPKPIVQLQQTSDQSATNALPSFPERPVPVPPLQPASATSQQSKELSPTTLSLPMSEGTATVAPQQEANLLPSSLTLPESEEGVVPETLFPPASQNDNSLSPTPLSLPPSADPHHASVPMQQKTDLQPSPLEQAPPGAVVPSGTQQSASIAASSAHPPSVSAQHSTGATQPAQQASRTITSKTPTQPLPQQSNLVQQPPEAPSTQNQVISAQASMPSVAQAPPDILSQQPGSAAPFQQSSASLTHTGNLGTWPLVPPALSETQVKISKHQTQVLETLPLNTLADQSETISGPFPMSPSPPPPYVPPQSIIDEERYRELRKTSREEQINELYRRERSERWRVTPAKDTLCEDLYIDIGNDYKVWVGGISDVYPDVLPVIQVVHRIEKLPQSEVNRILTPHFNSVYNLYQLVKALADAIHERESHLQRQNAGHGGYISS